MRVRVPLSSQDREMSDEIKIFIGIAWIGATIELFAFLLLAFAAPPFIWIPFCISVPVFCIVVAIKVSVDRLKEKRSRRSIG